MDHIHTTGRSLFCRPSCPPWTSSTRDGWFCNGYSIRKLEILTVARPSLLMGWPMGHGCCATCQAVFHPYLWQAVCPRMRGLRKKSLGEWPPRLVKLWINKLLRSNHQTSFYGSGSIRVSFGGQDLNQQWMRISAAPTIGKWRKPHKESPNFGSVFGTPQNNIKLNGARFMFIIIGYLETRGLL